MSETAFIQLASQVEALSYSERIRLLDKIVQTLRAPEKKRGGDGADFAAAFGLWEDREISIEEIRAKAWGRS